MESKRVLAEHPTLELVLWILGIFIAIILSWQALNWAYNALPIYADKPETIVSYLKMTILLVGLLLVAVMVIILLLPKNKIIDSQKEKEKVEK